MVIKMKTAVQQAGQGRGRPSIHADEAGCERLAVAARERSCKPVGRLPYSAAVLRAALAACNAS